jgi:hypothetical protein
VKKEFDKYFKVMDRFIEVVVGGKVITLETEPESATVSRLNLNHTEFLYPVGSKSVRVFRVSEEGSKSIYTIKIASLVMSDPITYQPFLACVKEAVVLSKRSKPGSELLALRGYFLVSRKTFRFWDLQIDLIMMLEDHDLTLLDLIRARKTSKTPWPKEQVEPLIRKFATLADENEKALDMKFLYFNPLNIVYSKASQKFYVANLNNIFLNSELDKLRDMQKGGLKVAPAPESIFRKLFPDLSRLYANPEHTSLDDPTSEFSLSILALQLTEISLQKDPLGKEIVNLLDEKMNGKVNTQSLRESKVIQKGLAGMGSKIMASISNQSMQLLLADNKQAPANLDKLESEIKVVNAWKDRLRSLEPDFSHIKYLYEAHLYLVAGNAKKAISSCKKAIDEFTKVKNLDILDWIDLVSFLVNAFMRLNVQDQAKHHALNLIQYLKKASEMSKMPKMLANIDTLSLRSIIEDPISILEERENWELCKPLDLCLSFHLYYLGLDYPDQILQFMTHTGADECFIARALNFDILYKLYLGQLEGLKPKLKA